ncbi:hypothetical protein [Georgenia muralis]
MTIDPDELLAGPRGRRLCLVLAATPGEGGGAREAEELRVAVTWAAYDLDPGRGTSRVVLAFADATGTEEPEVPRPSTADVARLLDAVPLSAPGPRTLLDALGLAVDFARYWQEPDGEDVLAAAQEVREALARVAHVVAGAAAAAWWTNPVDRSDQWSVTFTDGPTPTPTPAPPPETVAERLARWRHGAAAEEARAARERPHDPSASWSGTWWSTPPSDLRRTTRRLAGLGPAGLWLVEDAGGWDEATARPVTVPPEAAVYEIDGPLAWAELCRRYPLEVTASRRHDWYRTTGQDSRWVQPDWSRAAVDLDAVHLTVAGYLTTAGRAIPVTEDLSTVLAGWNPDETFWLTDRVTPAAEEEGWARDDDGGWRVVPPRG